MNIIPIPAFRDNYIWLVHDGRHALVVDPGDATPVEEALREHGLALTAILVTHHHPDHTGGIGALVASHRVPVYGPARESIAGVVHAVVDGDEIHLPAPAGAGVQALRLRTPPIPASRPMPRSASTPGSGTEFVGGATSSVIAE